MCNKSTISVASSYRLVLVLAALSLLSACASNGSLSAEMCPESNDGLQTYIIGSGDMLQIVVWRNDDLSSTIPVRPDGKISTPLVDDMVASGRTPSELSADMEVVLGEFLRSPEVSVLVTQQGAANQIQVVGEVTTPQALSYRKGLRVLDLIVAVGGLGEFAAGNRSRLIRSANGQQVECKIRVKSLMDGDLSQNILVYPGDVLVVPESRL